MHIWNTVRNGNMILGEDTNSSNEKQPQESRYVSDSNKSNNIRSVTRVLDSVQTLEGAGFLVHRAFPSENIEDFDPFLLLDEFGPINLAPGEAKGAPDHPHKGFETVTYMLDGQFEHKDSHGNRGKLAPGDVQWMTAGTGIIHSEMPSKELTKNGGIFHGLQLWVNLPKKDKLINPRYQDISSSKIPLAKTDDQNVQVKVIAGEALGVRAVIDIRTDYVFIGKGLKEDNNSSAAAAATEDLDVILIGGMPLNEPIARYGPFVMNTKAEVYQTVSDFQNGRMGQIK
jgi:redox-sensitive bicupin YhaK (pirin superfamily)